MSNETTSTIAELARQIVDTSNSLEARRMALKHLCRLRGEAVEDVDTVAEDELAWAAGGMTAMGQLGFTDLTLRDTLEAVREGRARRAAASRLR